MPIALLAVVLFAAGGRAAPPGSKQPPRGGVDDPLSPLNQFIERIDAAQKDLRTLSADFVQKNRVKLFEQELISSGQVRYDRAAAKLRWDYLRPDPFTLLLLGKQAFLKMPQRDVQVFDLERDPHLRLIFDELTRWLGTGSLRTAHSEYEMSMATAKGEGKLLLVPKGGSPLSKTFARIEMRIAQDSLLLKGLLLIERGGDEKEIVFTSMKRNQPLQPDAFKL